MSFHLLPSYESRGCLTPQPSSRAAGRNLQLNNSASIHQLGRESFLNNEYQSQRNSSPYINGKRNSSFCHPSYTSNQCFYDFDYSYKNDLPNPRLLSAVKNDKFASTTPRERLSKTPVKFRRSSDIDEPAYSYRNQGRPSALEIEDYHPYTTREHYEYNQPSSSRSCVTPNERNKRNTVINVFEDNLYTPRTERRIRETPLPSVKEEVEPAGKVTNKNIIKGKYCVDCINKSHADRRKHHLAHEKMKEKELSDRLIAENMKKGVWNRDLEKIHEIIKEKEKKEAKNQMILEEYRMMYGRPTAPYGGGVVLHALYEKHDEEKKKRRVVEDELKEQNEKLMEEHKKRKEFNRLDRLTSEFNSLQIKGNEYHNKRIPTKEALIRGLNEQIVNKQRRQMKEQEINQNIERKMIEADKRAVEKFNQIKQEKIEKERKFCEGQLKHWNKTLEQKREIEAVEKSKAKYYAKQAVEDQKEQLRYQDLLKQSKQNMFRQSLQQHQVEASYRRRHEEKKRFLEGQGNSLNIGKKAEMYPCTGCNKLRDKNLLSDMS